MFSGFTLHASIKNAKYDKADDYDSYVKNCIYVDFINSFIIALIANVVCFFWQEQIDMDFYEVNLLTIAGFCGAVTSVYSSKLVMDYRAGDYAIVSIISVLSGIALSLVFIFTIFSFDHYKGRIIGLVCGELLAAAYVLLKLFRKGMAPINIGYWKYGLSISLPIIPHGLSQVVLGSANRIIIKYIFGAAKAGIFSFTYTVSMVPQILFQSVASVWEPWFFERMSQNDEIQIRRKSNVFCLLISAVFVMMACVTPEVIKVMATEEYLEAIDISIVVLIGCYFSTLYNIPCEVEYFYKKTKHIAISTFVCALVNVCLNLLLMHYFGYKVAAYVTLFAYLLYFLFHMFMAHHIMGRWIFDIKTMAVIIIISIVLMALSLLLMNNFLGRLIILTLIMILILRERKTLFQLLKEIKR